MTPPKHPLKIRVIPGADGQFYVQVYARNGQPVMTSEGYTRRRDAARVARRIVGSGPELTSV